MGTALSSSTQTFIIFLIAGSVLVYLILLFDKKNRQKINKVLKQASNTPPLLMQKAAAYKVQNLKAVCAEAGPDRTDIAKELDQLVADYDKGLISLPDYCSKLNSLLAMSA